jgi:phospholipase C
MGIDPGDANLYKIKHIVVLMMENRSFDHMLGYLSLEGGRVDINGLAATMSNSAKGEGYPVRHLTSTKVPSPEWDPDHSGEATALQIGEGRMDGFAESFAKTLEGRKVPNPDPGMVMGYYSALDLPVYDHLAAEFAVCDQWHSSVPGATWPNRLYAVAGSADGSLDDVKPPLYDKASFIRRLDAAGVKWRWYTYDIGTLRAVDGEYRLSHHDNFAYVDKLKLNWQVEVETEILVDEDSASFLEDAANGTLPEVSWIDPNFKDVNLAHAESNDDHPPSDVVAGQELVFQIYNALAAGPSWRDTLLIVVYDEHGGFYDHVPPPAAPDDDQAKFGRYGVRVPALIVSPWVPRASVAKDLYDHTSIATTILTRFCPAQLPQYPGARAAAALHLGSLLSAEQPRPAPDRAALAAWFTVGHAQRANTLVDPSILQMGRKALTDLQGGLVAVEKRIRQLGLDAGIP